MANFDYKKYITNNPLLKEVKGPPEGDPYDGPWDETGDEEPSMGQLERDYEDQMTGGEVDQEEEYALIRTDILSTIDELNQYLNGNVPKESLIETLNDLALTLEEL